MDAARESAPKDKREALILVCWYPEPRAHNTMCVKTRARAAPPPARTYCDRDAMNERVVLAVVSIPPSFARTNI